MMRPGYRRVLLASTFFLAGVTASVAAAPDLILHHGKVVTVDPAFTIAQAVAVRGDRIVAVGDDADVLKLASAVTQRIDLEGRTLIPGLIDSHVHPSGASTYEFDHRVPDVKTMADVLDYIKSRADAAEDGQWIRVQQMFITRLAEQRFPTRAELDAVAPHNPVVYRTGPDLAVNSLALSLSEIGEDYELPPSSSGRIERDANGQLNGIIRGASSVIKFESSQRHPTQDERVDLLESLFHDYNSVGITSVSDRNATDAAVQSFEQLRDEDRLTCRVYVYFGIDADGEPAAIRQQIEQLADHPLHAYDNMLLAKRRQALFGWRDVDGQRLLA